MSDKERTIKVDLLARVEGEGAFKVVVRNGEVVGTQFRIFEPPRFFEAFLRGRDFSEAPDITARICGICPIAYQMSSVHAMEDAFGVTVDGPLRALRRLVYCGEWIESHTLHVAMLHAPDFLGFEGAFDMAAAGHEDAVKSALQLKKAGNAIVAFVGGREIHPINIKVGGFYKVPRRRDFAELTGTLKSAREKAQELVRWTAGFEFPDHERDYTFVALRHPDEYPMNEGRIVSNRGLDIPVTAYDDHFHEVHVAHSNALQGFMTDGGSYLCGPLARYNLNRGQLTGVAGEAAKEAGLGPTCRNPYRSIVVRAVEILYAVDEALNIIEAYEEPDAPSGRVRAAVVDRLRRNRGAAWSVVPSIPVGRGRQHRRGADRAPDLAEPTVDRGRSVELHRRYSRLAGMTISGIAASRRSATTTPASPARRTSSSSRSTGDDAPR